jgi:hypothetical protein
VFLIDRRRLGWLETNLCPWRGLPNEVAVSGFKCEPCVVEIEQGEAGGASAFDAAPSIPLRVVAGMPVAPGLDPLGNLESVRELEHDLLLLWGKEREPVI